MSEFWHKVWLVFLVIQARLRFIALLLLIGLLVFYWDSLKAHYEKWTRPSDSGQQAAVSDTEYFCPMHPQIVRDNNKEVCPICFMPLSKRKKDEGKDEVLKPGVINRVQLSPYRIALAGVQTSEVAYRHLTRQLETVGFVEFDERRQTHIAARVKGRIDKLYVNYTGQVVHAGDELALLYSPDLVVTVQNLLDAQRSGNQDLLRMARERLQLLGIDNTQIEEVLQTGKANTHLKIRSPMFGHVIRKYQVEGKYVDEGAPLYDVADLRVVWIEAQVYEEDIALLRPDQSVTARATGFPNREFAGKLAFIHPHLDQNTRTLKVRFDMDNPDHELRPGMYATVKLQVPASQMDVFPRTRAEDWRNRTTIDLLAHSLAAPAGPMTLVGVEGLVTGAMDEAMLQQGLVLAVPESAVIDTGSRKIVYREVSSGVFEGVEVQLGPRCDLDYPVVRGLEAGDRVVTAGSFLIDAETRLNPAAGSIYFGGSGGGKTGPAAVAARPSTTDDQDTQVKANRARLTPEDRRLVEEQDTCPILDGSRLGGMGPPIKLMIQGQPVFLCCKNCVKEALEHPAETLAKVEKLKQKSKTASPR